MKKDWKVEIATRLDFGQWMSFVKKVQNEFHGIDLFNDEKHRSVALKNIDRSTAIYVRDRSGSDIVGVMMYSPSSNHIGWLAVN